MNVHEKRNAILGVEFERYGQMLVIHTGGARGGLAGQFCIVAPRISNGKSSLDSTSK